MPVNDLPIGVRPARRRIAGSLVGIGDHQHTARQQRIPPTWSAPAGLRRGDSGLTTLEWLLITAAVAGLAALAVVIVQAYVDETGNRVSNPDPRMVAAMIAAEEIMSDADRDAAQQPAAAKTYGPWSDHYAFKCGQLGILYADAEIKMEPNFNLDPAANSPVGLGDAVAAANIETYLANDDQFRDIMVVGGAIAHCRVTLK